jgi:hypothetical protein
VVESGFIGFGVMKSRAKGRQVIRVESAGAHRRQKSSGSRSTKAASFSVGLCHPLRSCERHGQGRSTGQPPLDG